MPLWWQSRLPGFTRCTGAASVAGNAVPWTAWTSSSHRGRSTASWAPTAQARRRRFASCSDWSAPTPARSGSWAGRPCGAPGAPAVMRLLNTEVRRLLARRMFRYLLLVGFGVMVVLGVVAFIHSSRNVAAAQAAARAEAVSQAAQFRARPGFIARCKAAQQPGGGPDACTFGGPTADELYQQIYQDPRYAFAQHAGNVVVGAVIAVS